MSEIKVGSGGIGVPGFMFLIFLTLKLTGHITWSWWWVTAPLWIPISILVVFALLYVVVHAYIRR